MERIDNSKSPWFNWLLIWLCWIAISLFYIGDLILGASTGHPRNIQKEILQILINYHVWFALTFIVVRLVRRFPIHTRNWWKGLILHSLFFIAVSSLQVGIYTFIIHSAGLVSAPQPYLDRFQNLLIFGTGTNLSFYVAVFIVTYTVDYYRKYREKDLQASHLAMQLSRSKLEVLKMQLHPHFLFNTLNTISVLMEKDVKAANKMLVRLSDLLRIALDEVGAQEVPLRQEIDFLERYLEIEQIRYRDRLKVQIEIEPGTLDALVPNFLLQPLVENAIKHGIAPKLSDGIIKIDTVRDGERVRLSVTDNGPGIKEESSSMIQKGIGLSNTEERLMRLYGANHSFQITSAEGGGFRATVTIPFSTVAKDLD